MAKSEIDYLEIVLFRQIVNDIRMLMDLHYQWFLYQTSIGNELETPRAQTVVRAIELSFFEKYELKATIGYCTFGNYDSKNMSLVVYNHYWLVWKDKYIIDVMPMDGLFGISVPQAVFPKEKFIRFSPVNGIYQKDDTMEMRRKSDEDVEGLSQVFDELFKNVPN